ncbi:hypothetical protein ACLI4Z_15490 [Natrialbaceae archaeon A-arb3/5]
MNENRMMITAMIGTLLGIAVFLPILSDHGFAIETYLDPSVIINLAIFLSIAFVVIYISFKQNA